MNVEPPETLVIIESIVYKSNGFAIAVLKRGEVCPMPDARCPMPDARCPMPYARLVPHVTEKGYNLFFHLFYSSQISF
jgi:hypothetical protein